MKEGLIRIEYDFNDNEAVLIYERGARYEISTIIEYVEDMTERKAETIAIYEGDDLRKTFVRTKRRWEPMVSVRRGSAARLGS